MSRLLFLIVGGPLLLGACAIPQAGGTVDCRGATVPCGVWVDQHARAMSNQPLTVPISVVP